MRCELRVDSLVDLFNVTLRITCRQLRSVWELRGQLSDIYWTRNQRMSSQTQGNASELLQLSCCN